MADRFHPEKQLSVEYTARLRGTRIEHENSISPEAERVPTERGQSLAHSSRAVRTASARGNNLTPRQLQVRINFDILRAREGNLSESAKNFVKKWWKPVVATIGVGAAIALFLL